MLHMIAAGLFLCIGFWIGKKVTNSIDYHSYMQGEKFKEKVWPALKEKVPVFGRKVANVGLITTNYVGGQLATVSKAGLRKLNALRHGA